MWTPLSRTPICLDTVCCRLDNRNISLGETGTTILWKRGEQAVPTAQRIRAALWVTPRSRNVPRVGRCVRDILHTVSLFGCSWHELRTICICSVMLEQGRIVHYLYYLYRDTIRFSAVEEEKKKLIPSILFPIELNRFLIESLFLWVIDLTVWAN